MPSDGTVPVPVAGRGLGRRDREPARPGRGARPRRRPPAAPSPARRTSGPSVTNSSTPCSASWVLPSAARARLSGRQCLHHPVAIAGVAEPVQGLGRQRLGLVQATRPQPQVGQEGLHHQRRPGVVPAPRLLGDPVGNGLGLVELTSEVEDVGAQAVGPVDSGPVVQPLEPRRRLAELTFGHLELAGLERHPRQVVPGPGVAPLVAQLLEPGQGFVQEVLGRRLGAAEDLCESTSAQRLGQRFGRIEFTERRHRGIELTTGGFEITEMMGGGADAAATLGLVEPIARCRWRARRSGGRHDRPRGSAVAPAHSTPAP